MRLLRDCLVEKENKVSEIKLLAAYLVIISHAFAFACNYEQIDFMAKLSDGAYNLGGFAVAVFFFFSGLFITKSLDSGKYKAGTYFKRRFLRIFPPFILVTVAIIIISGLFFTENDMATYFTDADTYKYLLNCIFVPVHNLPGVFVNNIYGQAVNGPIWTIKYEVLCYIMAYAIYMVNLFDKKRFQFVIYFFVVGAVLVYFAGDPFSRLVVLVRPVGMFLTGMAFYIYREYVKLGRTGIASAVLLYAVALSIGFPEIGLFMTLPYIICGIAFDEGIKTRNTLLDKFGKCSYEIYLWGGFVGQAVVALCGGEMSPWVNMLCTIFVATVVGVFTKLFLKKVVTIWKRS